MTKGSIQPSMGRWQTHSGHDYNPGKVTDRVTTQISALSPAAKRLQKPVLLKGQGRVNPNLVVTLETKRGNTVPHIYCQNVFPNCRRTEASNGLERLQQTESHVRKFRKTRPGVFHKAETA